jgi:hypothetical protein
MTRLRPQLTTLAWHRDRGERCPITSTPSPSEAYCERSDGLMNATRTASTPSRTTHASRTTGPGGDQAVLIAELRRAQLIPACSLLGIADPAAAEIVRTGLPTVQHQRRTLHRHTEEHLFLDTAAWAGVRDLACRDVQTHRVRMHVAEVGDRTLWDRIVIHVTRWVMTRSGVAAPAVPDRPAS